MARKQKVSTNVSLFGDRKRRHPHLILPKLLTERTTKYPFAPDQVSRATEFLGQWARLAETGGLRQKETSLDAEFLRIIFRDALGYKFRTDSPDAYQVERQFAVPEAGTADGALGLFAANKDPRPLVVIECKGAGADLDHDKTAGRTPVKQLWDYLAQLPDTPWGILSNYVTIRLYRRDSSMRAYTEFTVADFRNPARLLEFIYLFGPDGLLGHGALLEPRADELLEGSEFQYRTVGDYSDPYLSIGPAISRNRMWQELHVL